MTLLISYRTSFKIVNYHYPSAFPLNLWWKRTRYKSETYIWGLVIRNIPQHIVTISLLQHLPRGKADRPILFITGCAARSKQWTKLGHGLTVDIQWYRTKSPIEIQLNESEILEIHSVKSLCWWLVKWSLKHTYKGRNCLKAILMYDYGMNFHLSDNNIKTPLKVMSKTIYFLRNVQPHLGVQMIRLNSYWLHSSGLLSQYTKSQLLIVNTWHFHFTWFLL